MEKIVLTLSYVWNQIKIKTAAENNRHTLIKALIPIIASIQLTACSAFMNRVPLETDKRSHIHTSTELMIAPQRITIEPPRQSTLYVAPAASTSGSAGIITGGIISSAITQSVINSNNKMIIPLQKSLLHYPVSEQMNQLISEKLIRLKWLHFNGAQLVKGFDGNDKERLVKSIADANEALLYVDFSYRLSELKSTLIITADVSLYKKEAGKAVVIYKNQFEYYDELSESKEKTSYLSRWDADNARRAKDSMSTAIKILPSLIIDDMLDPSIKPDSNRPTNIWYSGNRISGAGYLEKKIGNKYVIRSTLGNLLVLNKQFTATKHNWRE